MIDWYAFWIGVLIGGGFVAVIVAVYVAGVIDGKSWSKRAKLKQESE